MAMESIVTPPRYGLGCPSCPLLVVIGLDRRLRGYRVLLAPALARLDGVTDDPAELETAEAILAAAESADGVGLARGEIAVRAGLDPGDERFTRRFDMLVRAGALRGGRGEKRHQFRYVPDPDALLAAELLARLGERGGIEELHGLLIAAAERMERAFGSDPTHLPLGVEEAAALIRKLAAVLHAYAIRMEVAVSVGTFAELVAARTGSATTRQMEQVERITRLINREGSPYRAVFHDGNRLLAAAQRFVDASERLTAQLLAVAASGDGGGLLALLTVKQCRDAVAARTERELAEVAATIPLEGIAPVVHLADLEEAAASLRVAPPPRTIPVPPAPDETYDPAARLTAQRRRRQEQRRARRQWAERVLADGGEVDLTEHATSWPHAALLLADLMALSRDPTVPLAADIGDPPLVEPDAEVTVRHPLRLRRLLTTVDDRRPGTQASEPTAAEPGLEQ
jgi:hypothetical protein